MLRNGGSFQFDENIREPLRRAYGDIEAYCNANPGVGAAEVARFMQCALERDVVHSEKSFLRVVHFISVDVKFYAAFAELDQAVQALDAALDILTR